MNNKNDMTKLIGKLIRNVNALESVHVTKKSTSHYNFGTEEPFIKDRFDIQIELGSNKVIDCKEKSIINLYRLLSILSYRPSNIRFDRL
jgi:hypothetical protein